MPRFLDKILIYSDTFEECIKRIDSVFSRLHQPVLKLRPSKCEVLKNRGRCLGHVVSAMGLGTDWTIFRH